MIDDSTSQGVSVTVQQHERVLGEPIVQSGFVIRKCHPSTAPDPTQVDSELAAEQASEGQPEGRTLGIAIHVVPDPAAERLLAARTAVHWRSLRRDADIQQREAVANDAFLGGTPGGTSLKYHAYASGERDTALVVVAVQDLDGDVSPQPGVVAAEHLTHAPTTNQAEESVVTEILPR